MSDDTVFYDIHGKIQYVAGKESFAEAFQRLKAENAALREIVAAVAHIENVQHHMSLGDWAVCPFHCGAQREGFWNKPTLHHAEHCPITRARQLLGKSPSEDSQ